MKYSSFIFYKKKYFWFSSSYVPILHGWRYVESCSFHHIVKWTCFSFLIHWKVDSHSFSFLVCCPKKIKGCPPMSILRMIKSFSRQKFKSKIKKKCDQKIWSKCLFPTWKNGTTEDIFFSSGRSVSEGSLYPRGSSLRTSEARAGNWDPRG